MSTGLGHALRNLLHAAVELKRLRKSEIRSTPPRGKKIFSQSIIKVMLYNKMKAVLSENPDPSCSVYEQSFYQYKNLLDSRPPTSTVAYAFCSGCPNSKCIGSNTISCASWVKATISKLSWRVPKGYSRMSVLIGNMVSKLFEKLQAAVFVKMNCAEECLSPVKF